MNGNGRTSHRATAANAGIASRLLAPVAGKWNPAFAGMTPSRTAASAAETATPNRSGA